MSTAMSNEQQPIAVVGATTGQSTTDVEKDLDQFLDLLRAVRDRLPRPDHMTWKVVYEDAALQASQYAGRMSSCLLTAKVRKYVRYAAPRLVIGEHDDVVITILLEGSSSVLSPLVGAKAQERLQERLDRHEASKQTKVDLRRAAIQRTKQRLREGGIVGTSAVVGRNAAGAEIIEEVEEIEEIVEEEEEEPEEDDGAREQKVGDSAAPVAAPPPAEGSDDTEGAEDDVPPPPGPPPPLADSGDQDEPPPPTDESSDWDAPPPPPPPPLVDAAGDWDDVPPPPPPLNEDGDEPPPPPPPLAGGDDDDDWDPPPPPPPE